MVAVELFGAEPLFQDSNAIQVSILIDRNDANENVRQNIFKGLRAAFQDADKDLRQVKVYYLDKGVDDARKIVLALQKTRGEKLILAWIGKDSALAVTALFQQAKIPTIVLNLPQSFLSEQTFIQSSYPDAEFLGAFLAQRVLQRGVLRLGVLQSLDHIDEAFNQGFLKSYLAGGGQVVKVERYRSADYDTLLNAVKSLVGGAALSTSDPEAGSAAGKGKFETSVKFAKSEVQGLLVLDDFRMIRHIVKILRYMTSEKISLFGNYLWRSPALIEPREPYLDGSFFVDLIGKYSDLSFHDVNDFYAANPLLINPEKSDVYDFAFLGQRGADYGLAVERSFGRLPMPDLLHQLKPAVKPRLLGVQSGKLVLFDK